MSQWYNTYVKRMNDRYLNHVRKQYEPFISKVADSICEGDRVWEMGCGAANITRILIEGGAKGREFLVMDNDDKMLELACINLHPLMPLSNKGKIFFFVKDITTGLYPLPSVADVIHSHGVLEHFNDETIRTILTLQKAMDPRVIVHYVPGKLHKVPSFGDERLLSVKEWQKIANPDRIDTFNDGKDYILRWWRR